jgi:hypothetical protein
MTTATIRVLEAAKERLKGHWTQGTFARNALGLSTYAWHPSAVCFCAMGAIQASVERYADKEGCYRALRAVVGFIAKWNDAPERTEEEILAAFSQAIALLAKEPPSCP